MGQKILGLDVGSHSIKGAIYDVSFRSFELTDLYESSAMRIDDLQAEDRTVVIGENLKKLVDDNRISADTVVSALPGIQTSTRVITLPFDEKKIEKVLPFEIESYLPFPLEELIIDYHTISTSRKQTTILACAVKKEIIESHLKVLKTAGLDPKLLGIDSFALLNIYNTLDTDPSETVAIADLGHSKTNLSIITRGNLEFTRSFFKGGKNLTNALRMKLDLTLEQAERVKLKHGILEVEESLAVKREIKRVAEVLKETIDPLIEEIKQTVYSFKAQHSGDETKYKTVKRLYLCGGTSLIKNIDNYFAAKTGMETRLLHSFPPDHEISRKLGNRERVMTGAIGLGLKPILQTQGKKSSQINLRKNEFTFQHEFKNLRGRISFIGTWLAVLITFVLVNFSIQYYWLSKKSARIEKEVVKVFADTVSDYPVKNINSSNKAVTVMRERINKYKERIDVLTAGLEELSALSILREISSRVPKEVTIDIQELNIFKNKITLRGETDSFASVDKIIDSLMGFEPFKKVQKGEVSDASDPSKKKFSINITVGDKE